jgi:hypothetical protein
MKTYYITNTIAVDSDNEIEIGDNGETADARVALMKAPQIGGDDFFVYLSTNGDPVLVGWIDKCGEFTLDDHASEWIEEEEWLDDLLETL